ncbi:MAG TPA: F-box protein [Rhabdochlamydiaceae bacterium]|nr:F-box protein [Rhabdochlamydiaceae bacterium]
MSNSILSYSYGPFLTRDLHETYGAKYLEPSDIAHASQACKQWKLVFSDQNLWKALSKKEGIPLVFSLTGQPRDYREDFKTLYPITEVSGRKIGQYIGTVDEEIPYISEEHFNELNKLDPYEKGKLKKETWVVVVVPSYVLRTASQDAPLALYEAGNLVENQQTVSPEEKQLKIPLSLKNLKILCLYPLKGKENMPVFDPNSESTVFDQCGLSTNKINIYFMRRHIVEESRGKPYAEQEQLLKDHGDKVIPLMPRALFDVISILQKGNCPDGCVPRWTFARHPDMVGYGNYAYRSIIGSFAPLSGVNVENSSFCGVVYDHASIGVVPGGPAEVPVIGN